MERGQRAPVERAVRAHDHVLPPATALAGQLDGALVRLGAAVAEEHESSATEELVERGGHLLLGHGAVEVRHVQQRAGLLVDRIGDDRVGMTETRDGETRQEVEVLVPRVVPQTCSLASHERHRLRRIRRHQVGHARSPEVIIVPTPESVKTSSRSTCGMRPSRMCAERTPFSTAWMQAAIFGIMPPVRTPSSTITRNAFASTWLMSDDGTSTSPSRPSTSVRYTTFSAPSASAIAPATVSALMLYDWPARSAPMVDTTGISSSASSRCTIPGLTASTSPTNPRSGLRALARMSPASSPDSPTASGPCTLTAETMSRLILPTRTMRATSRLSASVTRRPSRNSGTIPSRSMSALICGPPPCTTTGRMPTDRMSTTSSANCRARAGSVIALPPYLTTTVVPKNRRMYGSASTRTSAFSAGVAAAVTTSPCSRRCRRG